MTEHELRDLLESLKTGQTTTDDVVHALQKAPYEDLGYAKVDFHRGIRQKSCEVIYGAGKSAEQITGIASALLEHGEKAILVTRLDSNVAECIQAQISADFQYHSIPRIGIIGHRPAPDTTGNIVVATAGTTDIPVAEEAAMTAEFLANPVIRLYDVGIAGLHRLLSKMDILLNARVIIAVAGMEGALPSVIAGLVSCPVIAVPTSVGYGASFHGLTALLSMLNSCASGVSVVNIDNGFGAAFQASLINHL